MAAREKLRGIGARSYDDAILSFAPVHNAYRSVANGSIEQLYQLLPALLGARDYHGAASVLRSIYRSFKSHPDLCVTTSMEILRRQPDGIAALLHYLQSLIALNDESINAAVMQREIFLLHLFQGNLYVAYRHFKDEMQSIEAFRDDAHVQADFGILCYWLLFYEDDDLRAQFRDHSVPHTLHINELETKIGTALLFQEGQMALRRAITLSPASPVYMAYYVQLLVMKHEIARAGDFIEHFYHHNPREPHACRMAHGFYALYYPDATATHVEICRRWARLEPTATEPLQALVSAHANGHVPTDVLLEALASAIDTCGSLLYEDLHAQHTFWLWQQLATLLGPVPSTSTPLAALTQRQWWGRVYLSPGSITDANLELSLYKAVVASHMSMASDFIDRVLTLASEHGDAMELVHEFELAPVAPAAKKRKVTLARKKAPFWRPSSGQLRMPHILDRAALLSSYTLRDALHVREVEASTSGTFTTIQVPSYAPVVEPDAHPLNWLLQKRKQPTPHYLAHVAAVGTADAMQPPMTPHVVLSQRDLTAHVLEDTRLRDPLTADILPHAFSTLARTIDALPLAGENDVRETFVRRYVRASRSLLAELPIASKYLHWLQMYVQRHGLQSTVDGAMAFLRVRLRAVGGSSRGFPHPGLVAKALSYFERNAAALPAHYKQLLFASLLRDYQRYRTADLQRFNVRKLCHAHYAALQATSPGDLPHWHTWLAAAQSLQSQLYANPVLVDGAVRHKLCHPSLPRPDPAYLHHISEVVLQRALSDPAVHRYRDALREWLDRESPLSDAQLSTKVHLFFDASAPNFPSPSLLRALITYERASLHYERAIEVGRDSLYWSRKKVLPTGVRETILQATLRDVHHASPYDAFVEAADVFGYVPETLTAFPSTAAVHELQRTAIATAIRAGLGFGEAVLLGLDDGDVAVEGDATPAAKRYTRWRAQALAYVLEHPDATPNELLASFPATDQPPMAVVVDRLLPYCRKKAQPLRRSKTIHQHLDDALVVCPSLRAHELYRYVRHCMGGRVPGHDDVRLDRPMKSDATNRRFYNLIEVARARYRRMYPAPRSASRTEIETVFGWLDAIPAWAHDLDPRGDIVAVVETIHKSRDQSLSKDAAWYLVQVRDAMRPSVSADAELPSLRVIKRAVRHVSRTAYRRALLELLTATFAADRPDAAWDQLVRERLAALFDATRAAFPTLQAVAYARVRWQQRDRLLTYLDKDGMTPQLLLLLLRHDFGGFEPSVTTDLVLDAWPEASTAFANRPVYLE
ncbi:hypothetical protein SPRG_19581 [Saprolegnia parasitica CBS 223.65]|uniref:Uncharacterized protein n=1 Tax=Saprolegnia parasitica (strain CBS 223.65) TaxID=695850 RepID=A0A067CKJ2_SAPPC|nr:hypothetical protein SPRG_19581 [Saprolegnia parasitica CBS 223.65]KDO31053.1 hypothetical protein SPRG_19581 [Saprolegnia parasitica CBS 223.65]|eukprot:XP_012198314.1 hypothetical protein SPRG_19581 [Saprolegnia parasitica CBS 223.65]